MATDHPILIVEDNPRDLDFVKAALSSLEVAEHRIAVARDGAEALEQLTRSADGGACPTLALVDIKLPKVSGHEVLRQARARDEFCHMPIVMMTGSREIEDVKLAYKLGANAFLVKPHGYRDLVAALKATLEFWTKVNVPPPT